MTTTRLPINQIIHTDNRKGLRSLPDDCIPLTVCSPPWDDVRVYGDGVQTEWNNDVFQEVADELWRVTAHGGIVCWHVGEQVRDWSESGTTSEQRLYFRDVGFKLFETLVITTTCGHVQQQHRYGMPPQYVFVLSKGQPSTVSLIRDRPNKHAGAVKGFTIRNRDGSMKSKCPAVVKDFSVRSSVWVVHTRLHDPEAKEHPAAMNEPLARDLIRSFSKPGDLVLDPFGGSGTTAKQAVLLGRHYLIYEVVKEYCQLARRRLERYRIGLGAPVEPEVA